MEKYIISCANPIHGPNGFLREIEIPPVPSSPLKEQERAATVGIEGGIMNQIENALAAHALKGCPDKPQQRRVS